MKKKVCAVIGTTGVGKSRLAVELAQALHGECINGDAMQVYQGMDILTNKMPIEERGGIEHHLIDFVKQTDDYHVSQFTEDALKVARTLHERNKLPILVGGTHYYTQSFLLSDNLVNIPVSLPEESKRLLDGPTENVWARLKEVDPDISQRLHPRDDRKIRRALEIKLSSGQKASEIYANQRVEPRFQTLIFWIHSSQTTLDPRLDQRVDAMLHDGLLKELEALYQVHQQMDATGQGPDLTRGIWQAIGYKDFLPYLRSNCEDESQLGLGIQKMRSATRRYARKQIRWITQKSLPALLNLPGVYTYVLDGSDVKEWNQAVGAKALGIAKAFQAGEKLPSLKDAHHDAMVLLSPTTSSSSGKRHFTCDICTDGDGGQFVCLSEELWHEHLNSRRHRVFLKSREKKAAFEAWKQQQLVLDIKTV